MKVLFRIAVPLLFLFFCTSSQILAQNFPAVKSGMSRKEVRSVLGSPELTTVAVLPKSPFFGPQESLATFLKAGASYAEWRYTD